MTMGKSFGYILIILFIVVQPFQTVAQFKGIPGLFALGSADQYTDAKTIALPFVAGVAVRFSWASIEPTPDNYNWQFIDHEIQSLQSYGKKAVLEVLNPPQWIHTSLGAKVYYYLDQNKDHSTYGDTLSGYVTWDNIYIQRLKKLIVALGQRYAANSTVTYVNTVSGNISRNLPQTIADGRNFWEVFSYNPDTLISKMEQVLDTYMSSFPHTALWSSMDYVSFEKQASGNNVNYVCGQYAKYGIAKYSDRFGIWREDLSGCTIYPPNSTSQWAVMNANPERTGAQMLWSVQDGPSRMNKCGITDATKYGVMKGALAKGRIFGMRYFEIYVPDLLDSSLSSLFSAYNDTLVVKTKIIQQNKEFFQKSFVLFQNYPNPFNPTTSISYQIPSTAHVSLTLFDLLGREVTTLVNEWKEAGSYQVTFNGSNLSSGVYLYRLQSDSFIETKKLVLMK